MLSPVRACDSDCWGVASDSLGLGVGRGASADDTLGIARCEELLHANSARGDCSDLVGVVQSSLALARECVLVESVGNGLEA